jgi:hypothetical protein
MEDANASGTTARMSAKVVLLDRILAHYGPETKEVRDLLRSAVARTLDMLWPKDRRQPPQMEPTAAGGEIIYDKIQELSPKNDAQRSLQAQASSIAIVLGRGRWLMFEQASSSISVPVLLLVVFWLTVIFIGFGLFAPANTTAIATLFFCALSVSGAIFLIAEMYNAFSRAVADLQRSTAQRPWASRPVAERNATSRKFFRFLS